MGTTSTSAPPAVSGVVTCAKKTKKTVKVRNGESYTFKTNADGSQYGANTKCSVSYKKTRGCKNLKISCDQFSLGAGDFLRVGKGKKNTFKGNTGPQNLRVSSKAMKVFFKSNRGNHGDGVAFARSIKLRRWRRPFAMDWRKCFWSRSFS